MPENAIAIAFFIFGLLLLAFGIRILIRRRVTITVQRSREVGRPDMILKMSGGPALLCGAGILVLGIRITGAYATAWMGDGDFSGVSAGGGITTWAIVALVIAVLWHIARKARSTFESPEIQKKISDKIQQAMDEKDKS